MSSETPIRVHCANARCGTVLKVAVAHAGKKVRCPKCQQVFAVPAVNAFGEEISAALPVGSEESVVSVSPPTPVSAQVVPVLTPSARGSASAERKFRRIDAWISWVTQPRPKVRTAIRLMLLISFCMHLAMTPLVPNAGQLSEEQLRNLDTEYARKVNAKAIAKVVADQVNKQNRMPPPPPDPEEVIHKVQAESITNDLEKVLDKGRLLDAKVTEKITSKVQANLKDELDAFSKDVAAGKLSKEEIDKRQTQFKLKAHGEAVKALLEHREDTQEETAAMSTMEWYDHCVSKTLFGNLSFELWPPPDYRGHPPNPEAWGRVCGGSYDGWSRYLNWTDLRSNGHLARKLQQLSDLAAGQVGWSNNANKGKIHSSWPGPNRDQAAQLKAGLASIFKGAVGSGGTYPTASWRSVIYGEIDMHDVEGTAYETHMSDGIIREYHPHREAEMKKIAEKLDALWERATTESGNYASQAESGGAESELKTNQAATLSTISEIIATATPLLVGADSATRRTLHCLVRTEVLTGPTREKMYKYLGDKLVDGLGPIIHNFAKGQFKKGKLKDDQKFDDAMKEFPAKILPLLRRDVERMIPKKTFDGVVFAGGYAYRTYKNKLGETVNTPSAEDVANDAKLLKEALEKDPALKAFVEKRRELNTQYFEHALANIVEHLLQRTMTGGLLLRNMSSFVEGVDYQDKVQEKLDARAAAMKGRGQDLTNLTADGVPDTSASKFALEFGASKGHGASLEPVMASMQPEHYATGNPRWSLRSTAASYPSPPNKAGFDDEQYKAVCPYKDSARYESIPFLAKMPRLDGDISEWGKIRPLIMQAARGEDPILVYAGWNYQGFFFAYQIKQLDEKYYYPVMGKSDDVGWAFAGDHIKLMFDTLDARNTNRGEPHTQEFIVFPRGTDNDPEVPGVERTIESQRDAKTKEYRGVLSSGRTFAQQPPPESGPDGSGPYRVTRFNKDGYTVEIFLPRSRFKSPVFAPGWHMGFDCAVGTGFQRMNNKVFIGQSWATGNGDTPSRWGDLLLLGTDAHMVVQDADKAGALTQGVMPGRSYLLTVVDPDRNVNPTTEDTVLVSAEVQGGKNDVEVYILKETAKNSGRFRGYINTQPGMGREVQSVLELMPGDEIRFGYVDFANSKGQRNVIKELRLPSVYGVMELPEKSAKEE